MGRNVNDINKITNVFKEIKADLADFTDRQVIRYVLTLRNILIDEPPTGTPVLTGWASNNWFYSESAPSGDGESSGDVNQAKARIDSDTASIASFKLNGQTVYLYNNVPYIGILNMGSSTQSPSGFVERAILTAGIRVRFNAE